MNPRVLTLLAIFVCVPLLVAQQEDAPAQTSSAAEEGAVGAVHRYANMPVEAVPFRRFTKPYHEWFVDKDTVAYYGAASERPDGDIEKLDEVAIGFLGPLENNPESIYGVPMLHGATLALEEANARGGYKGKPFVLKAYNDSALWGASSTVLPSMLFNDNVWAVLGSIDGQSTHILIRVSLKLEVPILSPGSTDRTVNETRIQWLMDTFPDDRQQGYPLADIIFKELDLKRVGVLRTNSRYARIGVGPLSDYARRIGRQVVLEAKFDRGDTDFTKQLRMLEARKIDGLVIWAEAREAALAVKQMRAMGMKQPVFASSRVAYPEFLELAGPAAEGVTVAAGLDPTREDPAWNKFRTRFVERWGYEPDPYAAYAYDGIVILTEAIERAGLNRGRIMEVLRGYQMKEHHGVAGRYFFDHTLNNIAPVTLGRVENGKFVYWTAPGRDPLEPVVAQKQE